MAPTDLFRSHVALAAMGDGSISPIKNMHGPLTKEETVRAFVEQLRDEDLRLLVQALADREQKELV